MITFLRHTCDGCGQHRDDCCCPADRPAGLTAQAATVHARRLTFMRQMEVAFICAGLRRIAALDAHIETLRPHLSETDTATLQLARARHNDQLAEAHVTLITAS